MPSRPDEKAEVTGIIYGNPAHESPPFTNTERVIHRIARAANHRRPLKRTSHAFLRRVGATWVHFCSRNLLHVSNAHIVVASNHRSYFDMYVISSVLLRRCRWIERMYFPVRSEYFYDRWGGLLVNTLLSGLSMYPPVYRDSGRRSRNREALTFVTDELKRAGTVVGLHPEGRRSTTTDPYMLLPAQPGLGEIVRRARSVVLPVFISGMPGDLLTAVRANFRRGAEQGTITITFGAPLALDQYFEAPGGSRTSLRISQAIRAEIERLGALDRAERAERGHQLQFTAGG
jgi:1-acyl-sn-glycerol-3-phosphate acyltransferase